MELKDQLLEALIQRTAVVFKKDPAELSAQTDFAADLKAKSVNLVQIITVIGDEFDVEIPFMEFRRKKTIGEAAEYIAGLLEG